jgi:hypothetical protein
VTGFATLAKNREVDQPHPAESDDASVEQRHLARAVGRAGFDRLEIAPYGGDDVRNAQPVAFRIELGDGCGVGHNHFPDDDG